MSAPDSVIPYALRTCPERRPALSGKAECQPDRSDGSVSYQFDDSGNLTSRTDARGIVKTVSYDEINRPTQATYSDGTPTVNYGYDTGTNATGRLYSVSNSNATSTFTYNNLGAVTQEQKTIGSLNFTLSRAYSHGLETSFTLPNGTVISKNYSSVGTLSSITSNWVDSQHPATLASNFTYHPTGAISHFDYGNGTRTDRTYTTRPNRSKRK